MTTDCGSEPASTPGGDEPYECRGPFDNAKEPLFGRCILWNDRLQPAACGYRGEVRVCTDEHRALFVGVEGESGRQLQTIQGAQVIVEYQREREL